ncbi:hypothetical protein E3Q12_03500 [Wallemia mellicola]|nr:hypothetical protein E3Q12_03500 [Wallemia mellicola]
MSDILSFPLPPPRTLNQPEIVVTENNNRSSFNPSEPPKLPLPPTPARSPSIHSSASSTKSKRSSYFDSYPERKRSSVLNTDVASLSSISLNSNRLSKHPDEWIDLENSLWSALSGDNLESPTAILKSLESKSSQLTLSNKNKHDLSLGLSDTTTTNKLLDLESNYESTNGQPSSPKLSELISTTRRPRKKAAPPSSQNSSRVTSIDSLQPLKLSVTKRRSLQKMNSRASFRADDGSEESDLDVSASLTDVASKYGFSACADNEKRNSEYSRSDDPSVDPNDTIVASPEQITSSISPPTPSRSIRKCKSTVTFSPTTNGWSDDEDRDRLGPPPPPSSRLKAKASKRALRESREMSQLSRAASILQTSKNLPSPLLKPVDARRQMSEPSTPNSASPRSPMSFSTLSVASTSITDSDIGRMQSKESLAESYSSTKPSLASTKVVVNHPIHHHEYSSSDEESEDDSRLPTPIPYLKRNSTLKPTLYDESLTRVKPHRLSNYASLQLLNDRRTTMSGPVNTNTTTPKKNTPRSSLPSRLNVDQDETPRARKSSGPIIGRASTGPSMGASPRASLGAPKSVQSGVPSRRPSKSPVRSSVGLSTPKRVSDGTPDLSQKSFSGSKGTPSIVRTRSSTVANQTQLPTPAKLKSRKSEPDLHKRNRHSLSNTQRATGVSLSKINAGGITREYEIPPVPSLPKLPKATTTSSASKSTPSLLKSPSTSLSKAQLLRSPSGSSLKPTAIPKSNIPSPSIPKKLTKKR